MKHEQLMGAEAGPPQPDVYTHVQAATRVDAPTIEQQVQAHKNTADSTGRVRPGEWWRRYYKALPRGIN